MVAGVVWPSSRAKTLVDLREVRMNFPPNLPEFEVHVVSHATEVMEPSRTPCFSRCSESS